MKTMVKEVNEIMDRYKAVESRWKKLCKYYDFNDDKKDESAKFSKFFKQFFDE